MVKKTHDIREKFTVEGPTSNTNAALVDAHCGEV